MKGRAGQIIQFVLFFGLGAGLLWWQYSRFTDTQREQFLNGIRNADYYWFAVAMGIGALSHLFRALRWEMLLQPLGHKSGLGNRFTAVMVAYLANYAFPRLGEVSRCGLIKRTDNIPFSEAFGTVVVERIIDVLCLGLIFVLVLLFQFAGLKSLWLEYIWDPAAIKLGALYAQPVKFYIAFGSLIAFVGAIYWFRQKIVGLFSSKALAFLKGIRDGVLSVKQVKQPFLFILYSLGIWGGYLLSLYVCFFCFPETQHLTMNMALILLLFGTFGVAFTPGGIGAYQLIVTALMIRLTPETEPAAASFSWLCWGSQVATVVVFTGVAFLIQPLLNKIKA